MAPRPYATCKCDPPRVIGIYPGVLAACPIPCGLCGADFRLRVSSPPEPRLLACGHIGTPIAGAQDGAVCELCDGVRRKFATPGSSAETWAAGLIEKNPICAHGGHTFPSIPTVVPVGGNVFEHRFRCLRDDAYRIEPFRGRGLTAKRIPGIRYEPIPKESRRVQSV